MKPIITHQPMNNEITPLVPDKARIDNGAWVVFLWCGRCVIAQAEAPTEGEAIRRAEYIVRAANALPECVKALEQIKEYEDPGTTVWLIAESALRRARGKK